MVQKIPGTNDIDLTKLNPEDPEVYTNVNLLRLLPPDLQIKCIINLAQSGQMPFGSETIKLEALLAGAGYNVKIDGQMSGEELAALQHFEDKLKDKNFKAAAVELIGMAMGVAGIKSLLPDKDASKPKPSVTSAQTAAAKVFMKLLSDPM